MSIQFNADDINRQLLYEQKQWEAGPYEELKAIYDKAANTGRLSCAFSFGVSKHYAESDVKIMIVGQEANVHTCDYAQWGLENWQKWAVAYLNYQCYDEESSEWKFSKNPSAFWTFINKLQKKDKSYGVCWNNIDKARRYIQDNGVELTEAYLLEHSDNDKNKDRSVLHKKIFDGNKSLLQKEIEIADPDVVVFAIGPKNPYYHSLCLAFFDGDKVDDKLNKRGEKYPQMKDGKYFCDIAEALNLGRPAFYTYHPTYLNRRKKLDDVVNLMESKIIELRK